jgi:alpha-ketoglutarate-dependent taurine dioxygenase
MEKQITDQALIRTSYFQPDNRLPLIVEPSTEDVDLLDWAGKNREWIEARLHECGGILFRGFDVCSESEFKQFAVTICTDMISYANFYRPEDNKGNSRTAVSYPASKKIIWHNEDNPTHCYWPTYIMFYCLKPASQGGETPIVDCRRVLDLIDTKVKERFIEKGVMYVNNFWPRSNPWQNVFGTSERAQVQEYCRKTFMEFEWLDRDRLRARCVRPAIVRHPKTGEMIWFNCAHLHHLALRNPEERKFLLLMYETEGLPTNCFYGDGSEIEDFVMDEVSNIYSREEVVFPWRERDILLLDNMLVAHGRNPFVGAREHYVAMSSNAVNFFDLIAEGNQPNPELVALLQKVRIGGLPVPR